MGQTARNRGSGATQRALWARRPNPAPALRGRVGGRCCPAPRIADWAWGGSEGCSLPEKVLWRVGCFFLPPVRGKGVLFGFVLFAPLCSSPARFLRLAVGSGDFLLIFGVNFFFSSFFGGWLSLLAPPRSAPPAASRPAIPPHAPGAAGSSAARTRELSCGEARPLFGQDVHGRAGSFLRLQLQLVVSGVLLCIGAGGRRLLPSGRRGGEEAVLLHRRHPPRRRRGGGRSRRQPARRARHRDAGRAGSRAPRRSLPRHGLAAPAHARRGPRRPRRRIPAAPLATLHRLPFPSPPPPAAPVPRGGGGGGGWRRRPGPRPAARRPHARLGAGARQQGPEIRHRPHFIGGV